MNPLRRVAKVLWGSTPVRFLRARHRDFVFWRAMAKYLKDPEACIQVGNRVLKDLIYGWGNESWSALDEYLVCCLDQARRSPGPLLECGSGLSTLLVGAVAQKRGYRHWALEHKPDWAAKVRGYLDRYKIDSVVLNCQPLKDYGDFFWYDPPRDSMPATFALVICDGPPGSTHGGRYGLLPVMQEKLAADCVILLDDAGRAEEQAIAQRWETEFGAPMEMLGQAKPYIKMTLPAAPKRVAA